MKNLPAAAASVCAFIMLILFPDVAKSAVIGGLETCGKIIIPSLFPFFVAVNLISRLGITAKTSSGSFRNAAFIIGVTGGYPIGASCIAEAVKCGDVSCEDASKLLIFCNNSGPAFIIGAVGAGVFHSGLVGILLYVSHILSAYTFGKLFCKTEADSSASAEIQTDFSSALVLSVQKSVGAILNVCGFVIAFSVLISMMNAGGALNILAGELSRIFQTELTFSTALITGIFELGNSISAMQGLSATPLNMALAEFLLGWGGISVHFQTFSVIADTEIKTARYVVGRFWIAVLSSMIAYIFAVILRI